VLLAVAFGLLAAFLFASSAALQQRAAQLERPQAVTDAEGRFERRTDVFNALWRLIKKLVRTPLWIVGWFTNLIGFGVQAIALHFGSVALVQPLLVTQLLFALPWAAAWNRRQPSWKDWTSALLISGGLAVFLSVRDVAPMADQPDRARLILACFAAAGAVFVIIMIAAGMPRPVRATMIAVAAGVCFAVSAAMIKLTSDDLLHHGAGYTAKDWPGYALAASTLAGLLIEQGAFAAGSLPSAVAAMSITNPVVSYMIGVYAFGSPAPESAGSLAGLAGAGLLICLGAVGLAHSPLVRPTSPAPAGSTGP
jgi:drug/metabolite transporter (DMT)-like permease